MKPFFYGSTLFEWYRGEVEEPPPPTAFELQCSRYPFGRPTEPTSSRWFVPKTGTVNSRVQLPPEEVRIARLEKWHDRTCSSKREK